VRHPYYSIPHPAAAAAAAAAAALYKRLVGYAPYTLLAGRWSDQYWRPTDRQRHSAPSITHSLESSTCRSRRPPSMRRRMCVTVGCPSVRPSDRSVDRQQQRRPAGLLLSALRSGDIDCWLRAPCSYLRTLTTWYCPHSPAVCR